MHGNASEWTRSAARPYPYQDDDGRNDPAASTDARVVRGGSWHDRRTLHRELPAGLSAVAAGLQCRLPRGVRGLVTWELGCHQNTF